SAYHLTAARLIDQLYQFQQCSEEQHNRRHGELLEVWDDVLDLDSFSGIYSYHAAPMVLDKPHMAKDDIFENWDSEIRRMTFTGREKTAEPLRLSLEKSMQTCEAENLRVTFDIDSVLAFPESLGFARNGIE